LVAAIGLDFLMKYSPHLNAVVCSLNDISVLGAGGIKAKLPQDGFHPMKYLLVSCEDNLMLPSDLAELSQWAELIGRCRHAGIAFSSVEGALSGMLGKLPKAKALEPLTPNGPSSTQAGAGAGPSLLGTRWESLSKGLTGRLSSVDAGQVLLVWDKGGQQRITLKSLRDKRRFRKIGR
jgi:hypothetical protein